MISYPYWFFFELCAPIIELIGFISFFIFALTGMMNWNYFLLYLIVIIFFGYTYSIFAILMEVLSYHQYKRRIDITSLIFTAFTEPFYFHPFIVWSAIKGFIDKIKKKSKWGEMVRVGFNKKRDIAATDSAIIISKSKNKNKFKPLTKFGNYFLKLVYFSKSYTNYVIVFVFVILFISTLELLLEINRNGQPDHLLQIIHSSFYNDIKLISILIIGGYIPFYIVYLFNRKLSSIFISTIFFTINIIQLLLSIYFYTTQVPLGADLFGYSFNEIYMTILSSKISIIQIFQYTLLVLILFYMQIILPKKLKPSNMSISILGGILVVLLFTGFSSFMEIKEYNNYYYNNLVRNKTFYFFKETYQYIFHEKLENLNENNKSKNFKNNFKYVDTQNYPFLHLTDSSAETLSSYFHTDSILPNIVLIIVEGLGNSFSNEDAYLGSFTPFLDSLSHHSLYWRNFLSAGGRTFAVLPSITGSLPFAKNGFADLGNDMPPAFTLMNLLKKHGYQTGFYYGGDASFDNMKLFMQKNGTESILDMHDFDAKKYQKIGPMKNFSWGYEDAALYQFYLQHLNNKKPYFNVLLTLSTHNPFTLNQSKIYSQKFDSYLHQLSIKQSAKENIKHYKQMLSTVLYADDCIKHFFELYKQRADFPHTIFIITGDYRMPEIPLSDKLDRYHVPLIIYSSLLKENKVFNNISTHFDIAPTLTAMLQKQYKLIMPDTVAWIGSGLDTAMTFRNIHQYPLMQAKNTLVDFISNNYLENQENLFRIYPNLFIEPEKNDSILSTIQQQFNQYKQKNAQFVKDLKLIPENLFKIYTR